MLFRHHPSPTARRGVVLILVLGMLGLLALIGVAFATFSGQAQYTARIYSQKLAIPDAEDLMEFALEQLVNDTNDPLSSLRGHGLLRDMYGSDAANNGFLDSLPYSGASLQVTNIVSSTTTTPYRYVVDTNIPGYLGSYDFRRWIMRVQPSVTTNGAGGQQYNVSQTFEVLDSQVVNNVRQLTISGAHVLPNIPHPAGGNRTVGMTDPVNPMVFELDGRYLRAFNGPGMTGVASYGNFRWNGELLRQRLGVPLTVPALPLLGDANTVGADEDYDAPDLENWFLGLQSADGQVVIPSFHRPGMLTAADWTLTGTSSVAQEAQARILRPRAVDHPASGVTFPDLVPDTSGSPVPFLANGNPNPTYNRNFGKIKYDVDNDGDSVRDAVWLDLGHPVLRDASGRLYKPLFAFTVLGLNGRLPLNTVGNLNARDSDPISATFRVPTHNHTSHLGYSPSEINPRYALQNAPFVAGSNEQFDNAGVEVSLTQLRNLLTGTRPQIDPEKPFDQSPNIDPVSGNPLNGDVNFVLRDGKPFFMPNNLADSLPPPLVSDLMVVATGTRRVVPRFKAEAVAGRWGESDGVPDHLDFAPIVPAGLLNNTVRAGRSPLLVYDSSNANGDVFLYNFDGVDDNFNTFDFHPEISATEGPESYDLVDRAGATLLPVERFRRFVTPFDLTGIGSVLRWDEYPAATNNGNYGQGPDNFGRVGFFNYFRPPGVSQRDIPNTAPPPVPPAPPPPPQHVLANNNLNRTHGYESYRNPATKDPANPQGGFGAAMPYNQSNAGYAGQVPNPPTDLFDTTGAYVGTFNYLINSEPNPPANPPPARPLAVNSFPFSSLGWNEPDELNFYLPNRDDEPFGATDLEWLYRLHDVDGPSLTSRLKHLAPVSFTHPVEGALRRRLFSIESWERNNFVLAPDNPGDLFAANSRFPSFSAGNAPAINALFAQRAEIPNASLLSLSTFDKNNGPSFAPRNVPPGTTPVVPIATPAIAHGDRRINLNFPLPHSYNPTEPVRLKWIAETYALLKLVLPPQAVDTPEELAALSQYVINIIDFRDPDNAITIFTNPDVQQVGARRMTVGATTVNLAPSIHLQYLFNGTAIANDPDYDPNPATNQNKFLVQYGMEYNPIALNEVIGASFNYADPGKGAEDRNSLINYLVVELVNTLTEDASGASPNPSALDLKGWDFVLVREEDPVTPFDPLKPFFHPTFVRPDPTTGQVPATATGGAVAVISPFSPTHGTTAPVVEQVLPVVVATGKKITVPPPMAPAPPANDYPRGLNNPVPALPQAGGAPANYFTVGGRRYEGTAPDPAAPIIDNDIENPTEAYPDGSTTIIGSDLIPAINDPALNVPSRGRYFWLYLLRPANPLADPNSDPTSAGYNPRVVVDSIRFPFSRSPNKGRTETISMLLADRHASGAATYAQDLYSVSRLQPYRGGQLVPDPADATKVLYHYGTSEQARPGVGNATRGRYDVLPNSGPGGVPNRGDPGDQTKDEPVYTTDEIRQTIGKKNAGEDQPWDYLVFHDRDFTSVAELLQVPGCPPGLFTKRFVEEAPPIQGPAVPTPLTASNGAFYPVPPAKVPPASTNGIADTFKPKTAHTFPYLVDNFYYSAFNDYAPPFVDGGPAGGGWHRILEFFEVPTPLMGAIGPVEQGQNFDWHREGLRPGRINLNLIIDEEVFFGLIDDPRLVNDPEDTNEFLTFNQLPQVVTQINIDGTPIAAYPVSDPRLYHYRDTTTGKQYSGRGFTYFTDATGKLVAPSASAARQVTGMKRAFADFLKLRQGGSGFLYAHGTGPVGSPFFPTPPATLPLDRRVATDRPFHALSYPDINYTVLRPAALPPSGLTFPTPAQADVVNPGEKNQNFPASGPRRLNPTRSEVPPIPPLRLFEIADTEFNEGGAADKISAASPGGQASTGPGTSPLVPIEATNVTNTYSFFNPYLPAGQPQTPTGPIGTPSLSRTLPGPPPRTPNVLSLAQDPTRFLGNNGDPSTFDGADRRRHPYFRTEMLQKVLNLGTVQTNQFAVWVTVGFFEVTKQGNAALAIPDQLGNELDALSGRSVRHRSFFIVDRSRAVGFNPSNPGSYADVVTYRRRIE